MKPRMEAILAKLKPSEPVEEETDGLGACAEELIAGVHEKDPEAVKQALRHAFEILGSEPSDEE